MHNNAKHIMQLDIKEVKKDIVSVLNASPQKTCCIVEREEIAFYICTPDQYMLLKKNMEENVLSKSCCMQSNIITEKKTPIENFYGEPKAAFAKACGAPLWTIENDQPQFCVVPVDIYNAMHGVK